MNDQTKPSLVTAETARTSFTVKGVLLAVAAPFVEGHVLRANEAAVLNQTFSENIRNNTASIVAKFLEDNGIKQPDAVSDEQKAKLQAAIDEYMINYDFGVRRAASGNPRTSDPVEREARANARAKVRDAIKAKGLSLKVVGTEKVNELVDQHFEANRDAFMAHAQKVIALRSNIGAEELNLGGVDVTNSEEETEAA